MARKKYVPHFFIQLLDFCPETRIESSRVSGKNLEVVWKNEGHTFSAQLLPLSFLWRLLSVKLFVKVFIIPKMNICWRLIIRKSCLKVSRRSYRWKTCSNQSRSSIALTPIWFWHTHTHSKNETIWRKWVTYQPQLPLNAHLLTKISGMFFMTQRHPDIKINSNVFPRSSFSHEIRLHMRFIIFIWADFHQIVMQLIQQRT